MSPSLHGSSGPVHTTYPHGTDATDGLWRPTFQALGLGAEHDPRKMDEGGHSTLGGYNVLRFIDEKAKRVTSASAFYAPNEGRENLVVLTGAFVRKVVFGGDGEVRAERVEFEVEGREYVVKAGKEVVLCAGTFQSPQLLELSGIGDREILGRHGVECVVHNPNVGENLQVCPSFP
jgi:choline dehydrogenase